MLEDYSLIPSPPPSKAPIILLVSLYSCFENVHKVPYKTVDYQLIAITINISAVAVYTFMFI